MFKDPYFCLKITLQNTFYLIFPYLLGNTAIVLLNTPYTAL